MAKRWEENFDALLNWLDPDRDRAGTKYEEIRESLINIFSWRGFKDAEDLTDETISRVTAKIAEVATTYKGDPAVYFYAVAKKLFFEAYRRDQRVGELPVNPSAESTNPPEDDKPELDCLDECLSHLPAADRELILLYYQQDQPKIRQRKELAKRLQISPNTVRVRTHRIRLVLYGCIEKCLEGTPR